MLQATIAVLAFWALPAGGSQPAPPPSPGAANSTPAPWHTSLKSASDDVKTIVGDASTIVVTAFGIILIVMNGKRIWIAVTNAALTISIPLIGSITLPARAAAQIQLSPPPPDLGLPPAKPGSVGRGVVPQHLLNAVTELTQMAGSLHAMPVAQQSTSLADRLLARPDVLAALRPHGPAEVAFYRRFYSALFPSQLRLLQSLAMPRSVTVGDAQSEYRASRAFGQPLSFAQWLAFPFKYGMIEPVDAKNQTATINITARGSDFLDWASTEGRGEGDLKVLGRMA